MGRARRLLEWIDQGGLFPRSWNTVGGPASIGIAIVSGVVFAGIGVVLFASGLLLIGAVVVAFGGCSTAAGVMLLRQELPAHAGPIHRCQSCGRLFDNSMAECPYCGSPE